MRVAQVARPKSWRLSLGVGYDRDIGALLDGPVPIEWENLASRFQ